jgi:hypothetical protein
MDERKDKKQEQPTDQQGEEKRSLSKRRPMDTLSDENPLICRGRD